LSLLSGCTRRCVSRVQPLQVGRGPPRPPHSSVPKRRPRRRFHTLPHTNEVKSSLLCKVKTKQFHCPCNRSFFFFIKSKAAPVLPLVLSQGLLCDNKGLPLCQVPPCAKGLSFWVLPLYQGAPYVKTKRLLSVQCFQVAEISGAKHRIEISFKFHLVTAYKPRKSILMRGISLKAPVAKFLGCCYRKTAFTNNAGFFP
jgi:hypothetical protein